MRVSIVLLFSSIAGLTACYPYVASELLLTPSPRSGSADTTAAPVIAVVDSLARRHNLSPQKWPYSCMVESSEGTRPASWGGPSTWLSVCVAPVHPLRVDVFLKEPGLRWSARGDSLRRELREALGAHFGLAAVVVVRN